MSSYRILPKASAVTVPIKDHGDSMFGGVRNDIGVDETECSVSIKDPDEIADITVDRMTPTCRAEQIHGG